MTRLVRSSALRRLMLGAAVAGLAGLAIWTAAASLNHAAVPCSDPPTFGGGLPPQVALPVLVLCFLLGPAVPRWRRGRTVDRETLVALAAEPRDRGPSLLMQGGTVLLLLVGVGLLLYETIALADTSRNWPITYYVRCATHASGAVVLAGAGIVSFLVGRWLWFSAPRGS